MSEFTELTRVQVPAMIHLLRLGYTYYGKLTEVDANVKYDPDTNILLDVFKENFGKLNPNKKNEWKQALQTIKTDLDNNDIGKTFYNTHLLNNKTRLIDFNTPTNNAFHFTAEFTCKNGDDEFRPDITLFINGLPLAFIEVKKPNNEGGMVAEMKRMNNRRFSNRKFRRFINITQLMIFSNNMEYDAEGGIVPIQGAFYCAASKNTASFNCFREENPLGEQVAPFIRNYPYLDIPEEVEKKILSDFNHQVLHNKPEYITAKDINTPTNRIITSMCSPERLLFLLKYGIAYLYQTKEDDGKQITIEEKHIMRYPQLFASLAIRDQISKGKKSGVVWHTQGSGKTALSYFLTKVLRDYFGSQGAVTKFYFIVDRLDLLEQASLEFSARGLNVKTANNRKELMDQFKTTNAIEGEEGKKEIIVVNIQRFKEDTEKVSIPPYATNLQRIFIVDEAHRGYNPTGSFLANLLTADPNAIKIALTGTPLLKEERASWKIFGDYYHTYYYDRSIQDGYTLKIIREEIETSYKEKLTAIHDKLEALVEKKKVQKQAIIEHENYVKELLRYIISDMVSFRKRKNDDTLGGMVICETAEQARLLFKFFDEIQEELNNTSNKKRKLKAGLILYDSDDVETRKKIILDFKKNMKIDILIVYNMLLTGFDAPRLKRLYFGRKLKDHNLLQAITRVNRPYKDNKYGYVIDFADIKANFEETNQAYMKELNRFNSSEETGITDPTATLSHIIEDPNALIDQIKEVKQVLFDYTTDNLEEFSSEISTIDNKKELLKLKKILAEARDCFNLVKTFGEEDLKNTFKKLEIVGLSQMITEIQHRIDTINLKEAFSSSDETQRKITEAMDNIKFEFSLIGTEELRIIDGGSELKDKWHNTVQLFVDNIDHEDIEYITLRDALMERFKEWGFVVKDTNEFMERSKYLDEVIKKLDDLKKRNKNLAKRYNDDAKFARIHKRIREENRSRISRGALPIISSYDEELVGVLLPIKNDIDQKVYDRNDILKKDEYFEQTIMAQISQSLNAHNITSNREDRKFIQSRIAKQYLDQYNTTYLTT